MWGYDLVGGAVGATVELWVLCGAVWELYGAVWELYGAVWELYGDVYGVMSVVCKIIICYPNALCVGSVTNVHYRN